MEGRICYGVASLDSYLDELFARGRGDFSRNDAVAAPSLKLPALAAAVTRSIKKRRLANPRHGFYLVLRPDDQIAGAPDPVKWSDPLMKHRGIGYRISLLLQCAPKYVCAIAIRLPPIEHPSSRTGQLSTAGASKPNSLAIDASRSGWVCAKG